MNVYKGRGAVTNADGRFEPYEYVDVDDHWADADDVPARVVTSVMTDATRTIIARNRSPDVPFEQSVNPYRGCEHGCIYCFARPTHAYLGLSPGLDFETKLVAKPDAPRLLREALSQPGYRCQVLALGTNTDPYQPIERRYRVMRGVLETLAETQHPVCVTTKSSLVERDIDLLKPMAEQRLACVSISITTLDHALARRMEPRATSPRRRLQTVGALSRAGIPVNVSVAPIVPVLTDSEIETILKAAAAAGAHSASYILLRLPHEVKDLFKQWLTVHYPMRAAHVMSAIRQSRGGRDNDSQFGTRRCGTGAFADLIARRFAVAAKRHGLDRTMVPLTSTLFCAPPRPGQLKLL